MAETLFFLLLSCGIVLVCLEIFLPGGVMGVIGGLALVGAMGASFWAYPTFAFPISIGIVILLGGAIVAWVKLFPRSRVGKQMTLSVDESTFKAAEDNLDGLVGQEGEAKCQLRPAGFIVIDGRRIDVITEGGMVDKGERVRIVRVDGNSVFVRRAT